MKKKLLAFLLAAALTLTPALAASAVDFADVEPGDWFYDSVDYAAQKGLMTGVGDGRFEPEGICDRAMFVTILHRMAGTPSRGEAVFSDVPGDTWYTAAVAWAGTTQLVKGYGDGRFGPQDPLSREQMLTLLYRYAQQKGLDTSTSSSLEQFPDGYQAADYARTALAWGVGCRLILGTGDGSLEPGGLVTRAQAAAFLSRFDALATQPQETAPRLSLRDFTASQTALAAGTGATVTFTVRPSRRVDELTLYRDDGVALGAMRDDGVDGDVIADDGTYTYVWNTVDLSAGTYVCYAASGSVQSPSVEVTLSAGGVITGRVCKAEGRAALPGAQLSVYQDGALCASATAGETGGYSLYLPAGHYQISIACPGFLPFSAYATVTGGSETYNETYLLVAAGQEGEMGQASGTVVSTITGKGMAQVQLSVRPGWNNADMGETVASTLTDDKGRYTLDLPIGNYTVLASKEGCIPVVINIVSTAGGLKNQNGSITPIADGNVYRVVLTWGESPSDLDSHMVGPDAEGNQFHVTFGTGGAPGPAGTYICNLDVDDTNGFGPETMTLDPQSGATYYYYVQQYSEDGTLAGSLATVRVYHGSALAATFNVPTDQGSGAVWNVFAVKDGVLVPRRTVTSKAELTYAD